MNQYISLYSLFVKNFPKIQNKGDGGSKVTPSPISETMYLCMMKAKDNEVDDIRSLYKVPKKTVVLLRIRLLISQGKFGELE